MVALGISIYSTYSRFTCSFSSYVTKEDTRLIAIKVRTSYEELGAHVTNHLQLSGLKYRALVGRGH